MNRTWKFTIGLLLTIPFLMSLGCPGFQRGPCTYDDQPVEAYISQYEIYQDSVTAVWFKAVEPQRSWVWNADEENKTDIRLYSSDFEQFDLTIDPETIEDTSILYLVEGSFMIEGTCSPKSIHSVSRIN
jgi:hypothetical protein